MDVRNSASDYLGDRIARRSDCTPSGADAYAAYLQPVSSRAENSTARMARQGWASAFIRYSRAYVHQEQASARPNAVCGAAYSSRLGIGGNRNCKTEVLGGCGPNRNAANRLSVGPQMYRTSVGSRVTCLAKVDASTFNRASSTVRGLT